MPYTSLCKMPSNKLNSDYSNVWTNQIDLRLPKLYFSPLLRAQMECIKKHLFVDVNWFFKAIWKSVLIKAIKFCYAKYRFRSMNRYTNFSITLKIFLIFNSSRKHKIQHFFSYTFSFPNHLLCLCKSWQIFFGMVNANAYI